MPLLLKGVFRHELSLFGVPEEVAPRDGWQKFKTVLPTEVKRELICSMIDYGARELEIGVFSSDPVRGRQYLDLEPLCQAVLPYAAERGVKVTALVESVEAAQRARALGIRHVDFFLSVSDAFGQGFGSTPDRAFATLEAIANLPPPGTGGPGRGLRLPLR